MDKSKSSEINNENAESENDAVYSIIASPEAARLARTPSSQPQRLVTPVSDLATTRDALTELNQGGSPMAREPVSQSKLDAVRKSFKNESELPLPVVFPGNFSTADVVPSEINQTAVIALAKRFRQCPHGITLLGHTDAFGSEDRNSYISKKRAKAVAKILVEAGFPKDRISTEGLGAVRPTAPNKTIRGRGYNRRVEIRCSK